jgi:hypothetical protein
VKKENKKIFFLYSCNDNISFAIRAGAQLEHDDKLHQPEKMLKKKIIRKYQTAQIRFSIHDQFKLCVVQKEKEREKERRLLWSFKENSRARLLTLQFIFNFVILSSF